MDELGVGRLVVGGGGGGGGGGGEYLVSQWYTLFKMKEEKTATVRILKKKKCIRVREIKLTKTH